MKLSRLVKLACFSFLVSQNALAKLAVVATTPDLASLAEEIGRDRISVSSIAKGTQDPHYIEAKPSYMVKVSKADLIISTGLDLESAWLPSIARGARNPKIMPGGNGYLEVGPTAEPEEIPTGSLSRSEGDVHPLGNPHVMLDPIRAGKVALVIGERLAKLDGANGGFFNENARAISQRFNNKTTIWAERIKKAGIKQVITYHKTLNYFLSRFNITIPITLEPKPGIPPTAGHILKVINTAKADKIQLVLIENYFDPTVADRVAKEVLGLKVKTVPVSVEGEKSIKTLDDLYEKLVSAFEGV